MQHRVRSDRRGFDVLVNRFECITAVHDQRSVQGLSKAYVVLERLTLSIRRGQIPVEVEAGLPHRRGGSGQCHDLLLLDRPSLRIVRVKARGENHPVRVLISQSSGRGRRVGIHPWDHDPVDIDSPRQEVNRGPPIELEVTMGVDPSHGRNPRPYRAARPIASPRVPVGRRRRNRPIRLRRPPTKGTPTLESGIARKIDDLGRIVIPAETRRLFNIREGDQLLISIEGTGIVLRKLETTCVFCGRTDDVNAYKGKGICVQCRLELP